MINIDMSTKALFPQGYGLAGELLENCEYPWQVLKEIENFIIVLGNKLPDTEYEKRPNNVWIAKSALVADSAFLGHNIIIGPGTEIRHGAFLRNNVLIGTECVVGNSTELKNSLLIASVQAPHFNYIGDSILGSGAHLGAGVITSNIKSDKTNVEIKTAKGRVSTDLRKMGVMIVLGRDRLQHCLESGISYRTG